MREWLLPVPPELAGSLERILNAATIGEIEYIVGFGSGFKMEIFANEHPPPHFHVTYKNEKNAFRISDGNPLHADGLERHFRSIRKWHKAHRADLVAVWNATRPTDCPVGPISR